MEAGKFLENARKISFSIVLCLLVPFLAYYTASIVIRYSTGVPLWSRLHDTSDLGYKLRDLNEKREGIKENLDRGTLTPQERFNLEQKKRELEARLAEKKVTEQERKDLEQKKKSVDEEHAQISKKQDALLAENSAMSRKHQLIFFWILSIIGFAFLALGYMTKLGYLGAGFIIGGVFCIISGFTMYWDQLNDLLKLGVLALSVGAVIVFAYGLARRE